MTLRLLIECAAGAMLVNNIVVSRFLGLCPVIGATKRIAAAFGMGIAVTVVMTCGASLCWLIDRLVLLPNGLTVLRLLVFMITIACLVQIVELCLHKWSARLSDELGIYLPLLASNCAVLGVILITALYLNPLSGNSFSLVETLVYSFFTGAGFSLVSLLMAGINLRLQGAPVARTLQGLPAALLSVALVALAFCGFAGLRNIP
ncbi:MAG: Rnf-Nqr domain containing protein [Chitinivibrionales bacterium]|nr:Rnf-Nqr domain containing protein [Chitinivibrionales bacterium]